VELVATRGGRCDSSEYVDDSVPLKWSCGRNHLSLRRLRWCVPRIGAWSARPPPWDYDAVAKVDPLITKYHYSNPSPDERQKVKCFYEDEE